MPKTAEQGLLAPIYGANDWLKTRLANIDIFDEHHQREAVTNPFYALGSIFYLVWFVVMFTGLVLIMWYIPTKASAFDSILNIQHHIFLGNLFRGMHKYGADAMIIAATIRLFRMFLAADYKPGKEFNIAIGLVTLLLSMYSGLTGYLLIWNQRAFWATKVFATFPTYMDQFPVMGDFYLPLVKSVHMGWNTAEFLLGGGGAITQETITRFFSLHLAFSLIPLMFVELYFYKTGYTRMALNWTKRTIIVLMLLVVAIVLPAAIGARSNPDVTPLPILSDWYFLGLYQMYKYLEPVVATEITMLIPLTVVLLPFIDVAITGPEKDIWKRPLVFMTALMGFVNWVAFSYLIIINVANIHNDPPYWRDFLWLTVNLGMVWQLALIWKNPDLMQRAKAAGGAMIIAVVAFFQAVFGLWYYYMAKTEMFLSPILQSFCYWLFRGFMGSGAETAEAVVRKLQNQAQVPDYWNYQLQLYPGSTVANQDMLNKLQEAASQTTAFDWLFKLIPTFVKDPKWMLEHKQFVAEQIAKAGHGNPDMLTQCLNPGDYGLSIASDLQYRGLIDYMISNRWCWDYVNFCDRMNGAKMVVDGVSKYPPSWGAIVYPLEVPPLDWAWMVAAVIVMILGVGTYFWCKQKPQAKAPEAPQPTATAAR